MTIKVLKIVCCGCKKDMGFKKLDWAVEGRVIPISHGICVKCIRKFYPELVDKI